MLGNSGFHFAPFGHGPKGASVNPDTHKRYTVNTLIEAFVKGADRGHAAAVRIGDSSNGLDTVLYSYAAPIAWRAKSDGALVVSTVKWSRTTSRHCRMVLLAGALNGNRSGR